MRVGGAWVVHGWCVGGALVTRPPSKGLCLKGCEPRAPGPRGGDGTVLGAVRDAGICVDGCTHLVCMRLHVPRHCRYKGLCEGSARAAGIATARLPISKHVQLASRAVLTVNHVFQVRGNVQHGHRAVGACG